MLKIFNKIIFTIITTIFFLASFSSYALDKNLIIRHAGGSIDGKIYTNSLEALTKSIELGYNFIELDLQISLDNKIIFTHDWKTFKKQTNSKSSERITKEKYLKKKIFNKYQTIDSNEINNLMVKYENLYLITDKINDFKLIRDSFLKFENIIIEIFGVKNYIKSFFIKDMKNKNRLFSTHLSFKHRTFINLMNIKQIAIPCSRILLNEIYAKEFVADGGDIFCYTSNDEKQIQNLFDKKLITKVYSDHL